MDYSIKQSEIGQRIEAEYQALGYDQETFAQAIGVARQTIARWTSGKTLPQIEHLCTMCKSSTEAEKKPNFDYSHNVNYEKINEKLSRLAIAESETTFTVPMFDCEMGYLLCESGYENKTRQITDICMATGLSQEAVNILVSNHNGIDAILKKEYREETVLSFFLEHGLISAINTVKNEVRNKEENFFFYRFPQKIKDTLYELYNRTLLEADKMSEYQYCVAKYLNENPKEFSNIIDDLEEAGIQFVERRDRMDFELFALQIVDKEDRERIELYATNLCFYSFEFFELKRTFNYRMYDIQIKFMDIVKEYLSKEMKV